MARCQRTLALLERLSYNPMCILYTYYIWFVTALHVLIVFYQDPDCLALGYLGVVIFRLGNHLLLENPTQQQRGDEE